LLDPTEVTINLPPPGQRYLNLWLVNLTFKVRNILLPPRMILDTREAMMIVLEVGLGLLIVKIKPIVAFPTLMDIRYISVDSRRGL